MISIAEMLQLRRHFLLLLTLASGALGTGRDGATTDILVYCLWWALQQDVSGALQAAG
jgi:hypothetical protein